jgi:hypothetical protein
MDPKTDKAFLDKIKTLQFKTSRKGQTQHTCNGKAKCPVCGKKLKLGKVEKVTKVAGGVWLSGKVEHDHSDN